MANERRKVCAKMSDAAKVMVNQKCPGGRREVRDGTGYSVLVTCGCGKHRPGPARRQASNEGEEISVSGRIQSAKVDHALRRIERPGRPATALEREIAEELSRPGNERVVAKVNGEGKVASFMVPAPYFDKADRP